MTPTPTIPHNEFSEICTGDMYGMDEWYHIILHNMRDGETFGECEMRLRSYEATGEHVKINWQGETEWTPCNRTCSPMNHTEATRPT